MSHPTIARGLVGLFAVWLAGCGGVVGVGSEDATSDDELRKRCGDGRCSANESCNTCSADCGECMPPPPPPPPPPPEEPIGYGPQASITCPAGAVNISTAQDIPTVVSAAAAGTTFCILAGTHTPRAPIMPRPGQKLIGQYGAIIDGANVTMSYDVGSTSIIRGWNCGADCSGVTVQNLVLRNLAAHSCVGVFGNTPTSRDSDNWTIDHNEMYGCHQAISLGNLTGALVQHNYVHDNGVAGGNSGSGYSAYHTSNVTFFHNEFARNGHESKVCLTHNTVFRDNYLHNNDNGIWYDGENVGSLVEGNLIEDHDGEGIFYEVSGQGVIRNNTVRRSTSSAIFISTSHGTEIYGNRLEDNYRGLNYFAACDRESGIDPPFVEYEPVYLADNDSHDNFVKVSATAPQYVLASSFGYAAACTATQLAPFLNGARNLTFQNNHYYVPSLSGAYWAWEGLGGFQTFSGWQSLGRDTMGTIGLGSPSSL